MVQRISFYTAGSKTNSEGHVISLTTFWNKLSRDSTRFFFLNVQNRINLMIFLLGTALLQSWKTSEVIS